MLVSYNTRELLARCLSAIDERHEVWVVDNASSDGSADMVARDFPSANLIRNGENRGFGAAINQALAHLEGRFVLLLNPDAVPLGPGDPIQRLADVLHENEDVVAVGGRLEHPSGEVQESAAAELTLWRVFCEQFMLDKLGIGGYWRSRALFRESPDEPSEAAQVMGACLMFRPIERMDERFFLYCEDTDLCLRLRRHGRILYVPDARFRHELGASSVGRRWLSVARYNRGKELYFRIHHGRASAALCWLFDRGGALFRLAMWGAATLATLGLVPKFRRQTALFFRVATAPAKGPPSPRDSR